MAITVPVANKGHAEKIRYLSSFSEDAFRDQCVRPLMKKMGMTYYRDLCGVNEEGKDAVLIGFGPLHEELVYAVQTKKGKITMAASGKDDLLTALRQLRMAASTPVELTWSKRSTRPDKVYLVASGEINYNARKHILSEVPDAQIQFWDANDLIPLLDEHFAEFWHGINADRFPYLRAVISDLLTRSDIVYSQDPENFGETAIPITDDVYVPLYLNRVKREVRRQDGKFIDKPVFLEIEAEDVLRQRERLILVLGEGGAGKTTLLRRVAYDNARRSLDLDDSARKQIPILFRATELARSDVALLDLVFEKVRSLANSGDCCVAPGDLEKGNVLVLVDALDEIASQGGKELVLNKILEFNKKHVQSTVVLTSREIAALQALEAHLQFAIFRVTPISLTQASRIVDRVVLAVRGDLDAEGRERLQAQSKEILRRLQDVHGVELSPFLVTIFVASEDFERKDIPPNITEIVKKFTEQMLGRWDQRKGLTQQFEYSLKDYLVSLIAYKMHAARETRMRLDLFTKELESGLNKMGKGVLASQILDEVVFRSGLFYVEDGEVVFKNHLFQEFFAGRGVTSHDDFAAVLHDDWWSKPVMFYFGEDPRRHDSIHDLTLYPVPASWVAAFTTATTVGLALQSAYFTDEQKRLQTLEWVVNLLSKSLSSHFNSEADEPYPLNVFLAHFLMGKEAVATELVRQMTPLQTKRKGLDRERLRLDPILEMHEFWRLVGLMEAGYLEEAKAAIADFRADDDRLLLALHIGAAFIAHFRLATRADKKLALEICDQLNPRVAHLTAAVLKEFSGILLEMRQGQVVAIDAPLTTPSGQITMTF